MIKTKLIASAVGGAIVGAGLVTLAFNGLPTLNKANTNVNKYISSVNSVMGQAQDKLTKQSNTIGTLTSSNTGLTNKVAKLKKDNNTLENINSSEYDSFEHQITLLENMINVQRNTIDSQQKEISSLKTSNSNSTNAYKYEYGQVEEANKDVKDFGTKLNTNLTNAQAELNSFKNKVNNIEN